MCAPGGGPSDGIQGGGPAAARRSGPLRLLFQDWTANARNPKGRLVCVAFRLAQAVRRAPAPVRLLGTPYLVVHRIVVEWLMGIELNWNAQVGPGLQVWHGQGLVVNSRVVIGRDVVLRQATSLAAKVHSDGVSRSPRIGDGVDVGAHVVVLGGVTVGDGAVIGAGSVVVQDVAPGAVVAGNPARPVG
ncbi:MAG: serine acetyltransferase [Kineosporiaceae bacterium]